MLNMKIFHVSLNFIVKLSRKHRIFSFFIQYLLKFKQTFPNSIKIEIKLHY